jgi:hypothetical protein
VGSFKRTEGTFAVLTLLWIVLFIARTAGPNSRVVLEAQHLYQPALGDTAAPVVLGPFTLEGRTSNLEVELEASFTNQWVYFTVSLLNLATGESVHFGREVSYYTGTDGGSRWVEGNRRERPRIASVAPGEYLLRIVPEGPEETRYRVRLRRDVPQASHFIVALVMLALPAGWVTARHLQFESQRMAESDYAPEE